MESGLCPIGNEGAQTNPRREKCQSEVGISRKILPTVVRLMKAGGQPGHWKRGRIWQRELAVGTEDGGKVW